MDFQAKRIERLLQRCVHFNGIQNSFCEAGVNYDDVTPIPCTGPLPNVVKVKCDKRELPTREKVVAEVEDMQRSTERTLTAVAAEHEDAEARGLKKGYGGVSAMPCPIGCGGTLRYSVSALNGHMHAYCSTARCVSWME